MSASGHMRLEACLLVLALWSCGIRAESLDVCYGYGCHKQAAFDVSPADMQELAGLFAGVESAADERQATEDCIAKSMAALDLLLAGEMQRATMQLHAPPPRPKPPPQPKPSGPGAATAPPLPAIESPPT